MKCKIVPFTDEIETLIDFLTKNTWTFHGTSKPKADTIRKNFENGYYWNEESKAFWIVTEDAQKVGMIRIYDLEDDCPLFDIRIDATSTGNGLGVFAVKWMLEYVFTTLEGKTRLEGHTREDNYAMRTVFHKCGFAKEAHHRNAWPSDGVIYDSIGYGITREDWETGVVTPVNWNDYKY